MNNETVTHTSNGIFEQKLLSCRTIPVFPPPKNPGIAKIILTPLTLLRPETKEIFAETDSSLVGAWTSRNPQQLSRNGVDGSNPGGIDNDIEIIETYPPVLIGIIETYPPCGLNLSQEAGDIRQSTSPGLVRQSQKLDATVDGNFSDNRYLTSIFSKVIGENSLKVPEGISTRAVGWTSRKILYKPRHHNLLIWSSWPLNNWTKAVFSVHHYHNPKAYGWCPLERA